MRRRLGAAASVAALALTGCGGGEGDARERTRDAVDAYTRSENRVLARLAPDVDAINRAYVAFAKGELPDATAEDRLARAVPVVREVRADVGALEPPEAARELHRRLGRYLDLTVDMAEQADRLAGYEPAARDALRPLPRINRRLQRQLEDTPDAADQARVMVRYTASLDGVIDDLRAIEVPLVQRPAHRDQLRRIERTRRLGGQLRAALVDQDAAGVARLLTRFRDQARERVPARKLSRRGIAAYGRRLDALRSAGADVREEQQALFERLDPR